MRTQGSQFTIDRPGATARADSERKEACGLSGRPEGCVVLSFGSNGQFSFEADVVNRTRCRIAVFDCTVDPDKTAVPPALRGRVELFQKCLGPFPPSKELNVVYDWKRKRYVESGLRRHHFVRYAQALELARVVGRPSFLKME